MSLRPKQEAAPAQGFTLLTGGGNMPPAPTAAQAGLSFDFSDALAPKTTEAPADVGAPLRTVAPSPYNDKSHLEPREFEDHDGGPWADAPNARPKFQAVPQNFSAVWTPIIARFSDLYLTDVDKKGNMPGKAQQQHWLVTFKGKTATSLTSVIIRIRINDQGDQLEGWALYLPDTDFVQSFIDFPPPPAAQVGFDSSTAVVVNGALTAYDPNSVEVVFSKLDESVERERRIERARQAWRLFVNDIKQRSAATVENVNFIRKQTYYTHFRGRQRNADFWEVDPERAPE